MIINLVTAKIMTLVLILCPLPTKFCNTIKLLLRISDISVWENIVYPGNHGKYRVLRESKNEDDE